jgi:hypothetical protein
MNGLRESACIFRHKKGSKRGFLDSHPSKHRPHSTLLNFTAIITVTIKKKNPISSKFFKNDRASGARHLKNVAPCACKDQFEENV